MRKLTMVMLMGWLGLFTGCVSGPKFADTPIPPLSPGKSRIYFYRSDGGVAMQPVIILNGKVVGKSVPGGFFYVDDRSTQSQAGRYEVICHFEANKSLKFMLNPGEEAYVRTRISMGLVWGHVTPRLEDKQQAMKTLSKCKYTGN